MFDDGDEFPVKHFNWGLLSDDEFEEFSRALLAKRGFNAIRMGGAGAGDRGRDIHAEELLTSGVGTSIVSKVLVQCKNYYGSRTTIGPGEVKEIAMDAKTLHYDRALIITSHDLSAQAKTTAKEIAENPDWRVNVQWWNEYDLARFVNDYPDLRRLFEIRSDAPHRMSIAVLNGHISKTSHKICDSAFSRVPTEKWQTLLETGNADVSQIAATDIGSDFDAIVNPFGEVYPEEEPESRRTYGHIVDYIRSGGLFVNTAGFPFFYYWDGNVRHMATKPTMNIIHEKGFFEYFSWADTSFYKDFKQTVDAGDPRDVEIFQENEDKRYVGDLLSLGLNKVRQFRSLTSRSSCIPMLRAENGGICPLAAIGHGDGYLIVAGLDLHEEEAQLVALATKNWILTAGGELALKQ